MTALPEEIRDISDRTLIIVWSDGHEGLYFAEYLRKNCPCAICNDEEKSPNKSSPFKILGNPELLDNITFVSWEMVGRYAVTFKFNDGHSSGIYPYKLLRNLCQCDLCSGDSISIQGPFIA